jgi:hypothetical protein
VSCPGRSSAVTTSSASPVARMHGHNSHLFFPFQRYHFFIAPIKNLIMEEIMRTG